jgi:hypothetical protein
MTEPCQCGRADRGPSAPAWPNANAAAAVMEAPAVLRDTLGHV